MFVFITLLSKDYVLSITRLPSNEFFYEMVQFFPHCSKNPSETSNLNVLKKRTRPTDYWSIIGGISDFFLAQFDKS